MKTTGPISTRVAVFASIAWLATGCDKPSDLPDQDWTPPIPVAHSSAGLAGWFIVHKYHDTLVGVKPLRDGSAQMLILNRASNSWSEIPIVGAPHGYIWGAAAVDRRSKRLLVAQGHAENEHLLMKALVGTITENGGLRNLSESKWITDKKSLHGETGSNTTMNHLGYRYSPELGPGIINEPEIYVPFAWHAQTFFGINNVSNGPFANGVFRSADFGQTWQMEKISDKHAGGPAICRTKEFYYYFAGVHSLWFSRKPGESGKWEEPKVITETFATVYGRYGVAGEGGTAHICWMDRRHDKWRFNPTGPRIENCDIYYRRRKDADQEWSREVLLSKGLLYCYAPTISAEGDNVVIVWAGIRTADKQHTYVGPNDIYYVTSRDAGKTWTRPLKVTDIAKDGVATGMPQVALLNGAIHLLYTQGSQATRTEISPGLTKLGADPWPIYYTRRPFPN